MNLHLSARERLGVAALGVVALVGLVFGWRLLWFLTDDAFIAFRYVSNSVLGYGYVWNPPPFRPVEGYTSFLWVLLLDVVWRVSGMQPPVAANRLALIFAAINSILTLLMLLQAAGGRLRPWRLPLAALALLGVLTNRTFLAWTSSGLETALFNCLVTAWVFSAVVLPAGQLRWLAALSVTAALSALTRPDGLLLVAATVGLVGLALAGAAQSKRPLFQRGAVAAPLLLVPIHLAWRYLTYGAWLPNTYYAKSATTLNRIESGSRYLRSFVVEYALWCWIALALAWAILLLVRLRPQRPRLPDLHQFAIAAVVLTLAAHLLYYTYLIGGDHFEFRVYSHLIPLLAVAGVAMLASLRLPPPAALGILALAIALSWPIPWLHWAESQAYTTRKQTHLFKLSVADALERRQPEAPGWLLSYLRAYDA
ncbi:MAG: hypothetical protein HGA65_16655, partial [Oscillochloris sp.]|nr:hypothetical protein [Oscillochloris sp.]